MPKYIDFTSLGKKSQSFMINVDHICRMLDFNNGLNLAIECSKIEVDVRFEKKTPKATELMKYIAEGNTDISGFIEDIRSVTCR